MKKNEFIKYLDNMFKPYGFRKKGNVWYAESEALRKVINLQKSNFGNTYYLNYGFIIKGLDIQGLEMHIFNRLSSFNEVENRRIMDLLDYEKNIEEEARRQELKGYIERNMLQELLDTNTQSDVFNRLTKRSNLNDIPLIVKRFFNLPG